MAHFGLKSVIFHHFSSKTVKFFKKLSSFLQKLLSFCELFVETAKFLQKL